MARSDIETFYRALCTRDHATVARYLADDVDWTIGGPVDVLPFSGNYRGRDQVLALLERKVAQTVSKRSIVPEIFLIDGDRGAALARLVGQNDSGQAMSWRLAQFFTMRDGKIVHYSSVLDSFDAAEQVVGHRIEVPDGKAPVDLDEDLFAV